MAESLAQGPTHWGVDEPKCETRWADSRARPTLRSGALCLHMCTHVYVFYTYTCVIAHVYVRVYTTRA